MAMSPANIRVPRVLYLGNLVKFALHLLSFASFFTVTISLVYSFVSALWVTQPHEGRYFHLEFVSRRARSSHEIKRLKRLRWLRRIAIISLSVGWVAWFRALLM